MQKFLRKATYMEFTCFADSSYGAANDRRPQHSFLTCNTLESSEAATEVTDTSNNLHGAGPSHVQNSIESRRFFFIFMYYYLVARTTWL